MTFARAITHQKHLAQSRRSLGAVRGVQCTFSIHSAYLLKSQSANKKFSFSVWKAVNHFSNSTIAFTKKKKKKKIHLAVIFSSKCYCWVWRMVDSLYYSSRKIPERCENSFVDYRINYQKLCYLMRQITKDLNSAI